MGVNHDEKYQWSERPKSNVFIKSSSRADTHPPRPTFQQQLLQQAQLFPTYVPRTPRYK